MLLRLFDDHSEVKDSTNKNRVVQAGKVEEEAKVKAEVEGEVVKEEQEGDVKDVVMKDE